MKLPLSFEEGGFFSFFQFVYDSNSSLLKLVDREVSLWKVECDYKILLPKKRRVFSWFWSKSIYLKQVMSILQNIILCQKDLWKFKSIPALILQSVNVRMALKFKEKSVNCHFTRILFMNDLYLWKYVLRIFFSHLAQVAQPAYSGIIFRAIYISNILQSFETNYTISVCIKANNFNKFANL